MVGATRFCEMAYWQWPPGASHQRHGVPDVVDIGYTWLAGPAQRTHVNTEAKLLMMTHAFEVWEVHRVALQTDVRNKRSWAAIERIGGQLDGIMRADRPGSDDTVRTSARFSIVAAEWPEVKERLTARPHSPRSLLARPLLQNRREAPCSAKSSAYTARPVTASAAGMPHSESADKKTTSLTRRPRHVEPTSSRRASQESTMLVANNGDATARNQSTLCP